MLHTETVAGTTLELLKHSFFPVPQTVKTNNISLFRLVPFSL